MLGQTRQGMRLVSALLVAATLLVAAGQPARADAVDDYIGAKMKEKSIPGLALAAIKDGRVLKEKAYGYASLELQVPVTLETSFSLASITKIFTTIAILQLIEQKKFTLDTPVSEVISGLPAAWSKVTVRHCLSHTTGLPYATEDELNLTVVDSDRDKLIEKLSAKPVAEPGTRIDYNATDFILLAMVIEKVSGFAYTDYLEHFILTPSGLGTMKFGDSWSIIPGRADLYTNLAITDDHQWLLMRDHRPISSTTGIRHYDHKVWPDYMQAVGGLNGSIHDLARWEAALVSGKLITPASLEEAEQPYKMADGKDDVFGLGFGTSPVAGPGSISYGGGAASWRVKLPSRHLTVIVLTNLQGSLPETLIPHIVDLYAPGAH